MVGQGHQSDQREFDPTPGGSGRQVGLACPGPWGYEESDTTKRRRALSNARISEGQILKPRLQSFGHLMRREDSLEKTLMLGKCEGKRRRGRQRMRWLDRVIKATNVNLTQLREAVEDRRAWHALVHGVMKSQT